MAQGFGIKPGRQRNAKPAIPENVQELEMQEPEAEIEAEVAACLEQNRQASAEDYTLAWKAGIYNPLAGLEDIQARFLESHEEDWLFLAKQVGWLQVEEELDAIYFTAPPPLFAQDQADWYLRPDLTTWLKEPEPLKEVVISYPISQQLMLQAIDRHRQQLKWTAAQLDAFIWEITAKSKLHLTQEDYMILLLELGLQL
jgi:hypothetical protein